MKARPTDSHTGHSLRLLAAWNKVTAGKKEVRSPRTQVQDLSADTGNPIFLLSLEPGSQGSVTMWFVLGQGTHPVT